MTYHPKDHPLPSAQQSAELEAAEVKYCLTAFDLAAAPLGSRDWTLFWAGWHARSKGQTEPSEAQKQHIISEFLTRTGQYVTNDASREAAIKSAVDAALRDTSPDAAQVHAREYYYRSDRCKASYSQDVDCVCWHKAGTGPFASLVEGAEREPGDPYNWRDTPAGATQARSLSEVQRKDLLMAALYVSASEVAGCVLNSTDATHIVQTLFDVGGLDELVGATESKDASS